MAKGNCEQVLNFRHSGASRNSEKTGRTLYVWIPAYAGMTDSEQTCRPTESQIDLFSNPFNRAFPNQIFLASRSPFMVQYRQVDFSEEIIMPTLTAPPPHVPAILAQTLDEFIKQQVAEQELADETAYFEKLTEAQRQQKIWDYYQHLMGNS